MRGTESLRVAGSRKHGMTAERVANAVWQCYRGNRRQVVVPWSGNLVIGLYRLLPGVFNWGMLKMLRRMDRAEKPLGLQLLQQRLHFALRVAISNAMRTGDAIAQPLNGFLDALGAAAAPELP